MALDRRRLVPLAAAIAAAAVLAVSFWSALGAMLSACLCVPMYGDPTNSCKVPEGKKVSPAEEASVRRAWIAGAGEASERCRVRMDALGAGAVFVADGERAPRAKELLAHECGPFTPEEVKRFHDGFRHPPLRETNPALCDALAQSAPPEAFALRKEGASLYFVYFTYAEVDGKLRVLDVYTKVAMDLSSQWFGSPPVMNAQCPLTAAHDAGDLGAAPLYAPWGHNCWGGVSLLSEDPERATIDLCYSGKNSFRHTSEPLEAVRDGG